VEGPEKFSVLPKVSEVETNIVHEAAMLGFLEQSSLASLMELFRFAFQYLKQGSSMYLR